MGLRERSKFVTVTPIQLSEFPKTRTEKQNDYINIERPAPVVWPLLVFLIFIGLKATKQRTTPSLPIYFLPLLGILSFNAVNTLAATSLVWIVFSLFYLIAVGADFAFQKTVTLAKTSHRITLAGEWVTLILLMTIFGMNFIDGTIQATMPDVYTSPTFHIIFAIIDGLTSGTFLGRAERVFLTKETVSVIINS